MFTNKVDEHISFKIPSIKDAKPLYDLIDQQRVELSRWLPWAQSTVSPSDEENFIRYCHHQIADEKLYSVVILFDEEVGGMADIHGIDHNNKRAQIGYWLGEQFQGKGIMTKSVNQLVKIAFDELKFHRLEIVADAKNINSQRVALRCDFKKDAELKDYLFYHNAFHNIFLYSKLNTN